MVEPVNNLGNNKVPQGYTKIKMYDEKAKKTKTFLVPVGKQIEVNGKVYDPSKGKNNELVITRGKNFKEGYDLIEMALNRMDVNQDGKIDEKDSSGNLAPKLNRDLDKKGLGKYYVKDVKDAYSDAGISKGEGGVTFSHDGNDFKYSIYLEDKNK